MFNKVLIANRGAIAVRIERTLKKLGVSSVAIYTKADQDSLHVSHADEAVLIGDGPAKDSYLNADLILNTAVERGADAIHPGYGFLSENAEFARACQKRGIAFIGPTPEQIELFGLKHTARKIAERAKVPMLPGTGLIGDLSEAIQKAETIGYPVILKSTAGGGGIGMRLCRTSQELCKAYETVHHLAETNFNNDGLYLEKYVRPARHIEVQIFGNSDGEIVALGERDCSIQRRNQKVIEETPAPHLPDDVRKDMFASAVRLAKAANYRNAGTVEFLYDQPSKNYYFLEVNTRLQVEHGVTEEVLSIDLVEWMIRESAGELSGLQDLVPRPQGHSIQVRVYAEDPVQNFRPSTGLISKVIFSERMRNETWVRDGITVSSFYDPMLAKIIVHGSTRTDALAKLRIALNETRFYGITTNLHYLSALIDEEDYKKGKIHTQFLTTFHPAERTLEVLDGGIQTTVQDWPGRIGHWDVGVPPCGPMDAYAFRIGNKLLNNPDNASGLEFTLRGGTYRFRDDIAFCLTGADMSATLAGESIPMYQVIDGKKGQTLQLHEAKTGMRTYLLVSCGFDMPKFLGSSSTFTLGKFGGQSGRALKMSDVLSVCPPNPSVKSSPEVSDLKPIMTHEWTLGVVPGPHCTEEFLKPGYLKQLTDTTWKVHFNSSRTGVRLIGPPPKWSRKDGGEAGLHPSNIHDTPYAIGAVDLTGDMPILLGPDGPSLGGFVCPVTVPSAERWKIGQLHPEDKLTFKLLSLEDAEVLRQEQEETLRSIGKEKTGGTKQPVIKTGFKALSADYPILALETEKRLFPITIRCSGDENLLIEYGRMELNLLLRFQIHHLMQALQKERSLPVLDLTPGIRSLQVHIDSTKMSVREACKRILEIDQGLSPLESAKVPSRIVRLPLSWNDPATRLATKRYQQNVRPNAPWCPSNLEFIRRINGLDSIEDVKNIIFNANYLVLGLGDVYLGAPVAVPLDPRHRLVTTKYNPARTWTPENAVGIGGAYMCVYGMEGPGGYQFVGRTIQMWNSLQPTQSFKPGKPWLLRFFDQVQFYPVTDSELLELREDFPRGKFEADIKDTTFDLGQYLSFLVSIKESTAEFQKKQRKAFNKERDNWRRLGLDKFISEHDEPLLKKESAVADGTTAVKSELPGNVWKILVKEGQKIKKGETVVIEESMKMEFPQKAACDGTIQTVFVHEGDEVHAGQTILSIKTL